MTETQPVRVAPATTPCPSWCEHPGGHPLRRQPLADARGHRRTDRPRARIVLYRRPLEARARGGADLADLLHEVLVEQVAEYLNIEPDVVDGGEARLTEVSADRLAELLQLAAKCLRDES